MLHLGFPPVKMRKPKATIESLPLEVDFMIIERLRLKDALNMAKALRIPEQVAVQYFACDGRGDINDILYKDLYDLQPSSFKFLLKNKSFQVEASSQDKTLAALRTLDLDFVKKYLEQVKPDLNYALRAASSCGFTDAVKLLLLDYGVDPSVRDNEALIYASQNGHKEIFKINRWCKLSSSLKTKWENDFSTLNTVESELKLMLLKLEDFVRFKIL
jgi:hypothetical protein